MTITHKISIDLLRQEQPARIDAVQNDCGRTLALMLHANGIPWSVPEGVTALVRYRKSDNIGGEYDTLPDGSTACRTDGNVLTVALAPQVLTTAGETKLSVLLVKGSAAIRTFHILLQVQPDLTGFLSESETYVRLSAKEDSLTDIGAKIISGEIVSIVLLGDSITDGAGGSEYNGSYTGALSTNTKGYCWANAFKHFTETRYGTKVRNAGMYGTVMEAQKNAALDIVSREDFVIWLTGTNDRNWPEDYENHLRGNLEAVRKKCGGMLVISNLPSTRADENDHTVNMQKMDEIVTRATAGYVPHFSMYREFFQFCESRGVSFGDCFADHVHPNDRGYFIMFKILCSKLGLPMDPYVDYQYGSAWWKEAATDSGGDPGGDNTGGDSSDDETDTCSCDGSEPALITNTDTRTEDLCTEGIYLYSDIVPCSVMTGYDAAEATTALSGKHISRAALHVFTPGMITFGTVDLTQVGSASPAYLKSKQISVAQTGVVEFPVHIDVGAHETLAIQSTADTGKLGFFFSDNGDDHLHIWKPTSFAGAEAPGYLYIFGTIYGK